MNSLTLSISCENMTGYMNEFIEFRLKHDVNSWPPVSMIDHPEFKLFMLIIEDTAIELTCHTIEYDPMITLKFVSCEVLSHLNNTIPDINNKYLYENIIQILVDYSITIIDTAWSDTDMYHTHLIYLNEILNKYYVHKPTLISYKTLPFGDRLPDTHQELILKYKFHQENKYWLRYQYLLKHINPVLDYLEKKLIKSKDYLH